MPRTVTFVEAPIEVDFETELQPFLFEVHGTLYDDEPRFGIDFVIHDRAGAVVGAGEIKGTVENPLALSIDLPPVVAIYGLCVGGSVVRALIGTIIECDKDSRDENREMGARERARDIFGRVSRRREDLLLAGKKSLANCLPNFWQR